MSYPYPQDRTRDKQDEGEQPYKDAKEAMSQEQAQLRDEAQTGGPRPAESPEAHEAELQERLIRVQQELADQDGGS